MSKESNNLHSRDEYLGSIKRLDSQFVEWSEPKFACPKCEVGGVRKHLYHKLCLTLFPPTIQSYYACDNSKCDYYDYIQD